MKVRGTESLSPRLSLSRLRRSFLGWEVGGYSNPMGAGTGSAKIRCAQCEQSENSCTCEKYCVLCQSVIDVRLCEDGLMYCEPCRSACDYKPAS